MRSPFAHDEASCVILSLDLRCILKFAKKRKEEAKRARLRQSRPSVTDALEAANSLQPRQNVHMCRFDVRKLCPDDSAELPRMPE
jgi:hypothetical protein